MADGREDYEAIVEALAHVGYALLDQVFSPTSSGEPFVRKVCRVIPGPAQGRRSGPCIDMSRRWTLELQFRPTAQSESFALREEVFREEERALDALFELQNVRDDVSWSYGTGDQEGFLKVRMEISTTYDRAVGSTA